MLTDFYGDNTRWFIADVIDSTPPFGLEGRVRIRIHGVHSPSTKDIPQKDLPWAQMVLPTTEGGVSGIGLTPKLSTGSLVFGVFMDGKASQIPLVIGSIPRIEYPSRIQQRLEFDTVLERVSKKDEFYQNSVSSIDEESSGIRNEETGSVQRNIRDARQAAAVKFFLSNGYTMKQCCAIVGGIKYRSKYATVYTNTDDGSIGLGGWSGQRFLDLKNFSNEWPKFSVQLAFVLYELNTTQQQANSKLISLNNLDTNQKNCQTIIARNYLKLTKTSDISAIVNEANNIYEEYIG
jgi:hypothetical protein